MSDLSGKQLGSFRLYEPIGRGGMSIVYTGRHTETGQVAAIKVMQIETVSDASVIRRFEREVNLIGQAKHPNIVAVYESGRQGEMLYLTMQLLAGGSLAHLIHSRSLLPLDQVAQLFEQIASALAYAHQLNIVHRDLKPQNVLLDLDQNAYLADFGIAKLMHETATQGVTATGIMGTPAYMAPEQWHNESVDERTDIYAMGILLFEMLTGRPPFVADTPMGIMNKHLSEPPPSLALLRSEAPAGLSRVLDRALAKAPEHRFGSVPELAESVKRNLSGQSVSLVAVPKIRLGQTIPKVQNDETMPLFIDNPTDALSPGQLAAEDGTRRLYPGPGKESDQADKPMRLALGALSALIYGTGWLLLVGIVVGLAALGLRHRLTATSPFEYGLIALGLIAGALGIFMPLRVISRVRPLTGTTWLGRTVLIGCFFLPGTILVILALLRVVPR